MNTLFNSIVGISTEYYEPTLKNEYKNKLIEESIRGLSNLQKPLLSFWNICHTKMDTMAEWANYINNDMKLLKDLSKQEIEYDPIFIIDYEYVSKAEYVRQMAELHKYMHSKIIHAPIKYQNTSSNLIIDLIDDALYNVMKANVRIPKTAKQYSDRRKRISKAISDINKLQRPLSIYFSMLNYSDKEISKLSNLISNELKLLYAINKSDKIRFSNLN